MADKRASEEAVASLMVEVRRLYDALQAFDLAAARKLGVNRTDLQCLLMLEHGPVRAGVLSSEVGLTSGSTTALLDRLEERGFVRRRIAKDDRRAIEIELTPRGRKRIGAIYRSAYQAFATRGAAHDDLDAAVRVLTDLVDGCREASQALARTKQRRRRQ
ncbi:MAG: MarR family transcriptional regulator [Myxococcota bacterium]